MKYIKYIIAVMCIFGLLRVSHSAPIEVENITAMDANTLSVTLSENPNLDVGELDGEVTLLQNIQTRGAIKSEMSENSIEIMLEDPIMGNTNYSLLTISGADGNIDFTTPSNINGYIAENQNMESTGIRKIEIIDDRTLIVYYENPIGGNAFEYKLMAESKVTKIEKPDYFMPELTLSVEPPLISNQDYILMFIQMQDVDGNFLEFDTGIYDFSTGEIVTPENNGESDMNIDFQDMSPENDFSDESALGNNVMASNNILLGEEIIMLSPDDIRLSFNAAPEEDMLEQDDETRDIEEVAMQVDETPDTGAGTWMILIGTLVINSFYYLARRKKRLLHT